MGYKIEDVQGIGLSYCTKLATAGVYTTDHLLDSCRTPKGRRELENRTGLPAARLLNWANMADLMRIRGIGPQFAELLHGSGIDTVKELATRNAANLAETVSNVNKQKRLALSTPTASRIHEWVKLAKRMESRIEY